MTDRRHGAQEARRKLVFESLEARRLLACGSEAERRLVTTTADVLDEDANTWSLREAIIEANAQKKCNIVLLPPGIYRLTRQGSDETGGDLNVEFKAGFSAGLEIRSEVPDSDPNVTVILGYWSGGGDDPKHGLISVAAGAHLSIADITLEGGETSYKGGAIYSQGQLTVKNSILRSNRAARPGGAIAIDTAATAEIENSYLHGNVSDSHGGAIAHDGGRLELRSSTLYDNRAGQRGGALAVVSGTAKITNSTISTNQADQEGGGLSVPSNSIVNVLNSTIYMNESRGDGGGIYADAAGTAIIENSIVAGNAAWRQNLTDALVDQGMNIRGRVESKGNNVYGDVVMAVDLQVQATDLVFRNPRLGPLAMNGGKTPTHALRNGSTAIGAGTNRNTDPALDLDQAGVRRGNVFDIGAVEFRPKGGALGGDTNGDDRVDLDDLNNVRNHFGATGPGAPGDTSPFDQRVDLNDLNNVRNNFGACYAQPIDVGDLPQCRPGARQYRAIPNDTIDDTTAIQFALNEARIRGETNVRIPPGEFLIEQLVFQGYALSLTGPGTLKRVPGTDAFALLTAFGAKSSIGEHPDTAFDPQVPTPAGFRPSNWIDGITIDGRRDVRRTEEFVGLDVAGDGLLVSNLTVRNTRFGTGMETNPARVGINIRVSGNHNHFRSVDSKNAGHTAFRNVGDENRYVDILAEDFGCRGFRAQIPSDKEFGGGIYIEGVDARAEPEFATISNGANCGEENSVAAILIDPVPAGDQASRQRITYVELKNLDITGPEVVSAGNLVKIAAVENIRIENSRFQHESTLLHSLRFGEGVEKSLPGGSTQQATTIEIIDSWLARSLVFEHEEGRPIVKRVTMTNVSIGAGVGDQDAADRRHSIFGLRVWDSFQANRLSLSNFSDSAIQWRIPTPPAGEAPSAALKITDSTFQGSSDKGVYVIRLIQPHGAVACGRTKNWSGNSLTNSPGPATPFPGADEFPCQAWDFGAASSSSNDRQIIATDRVFHNWDSTAILIGWSTDDHVGVIQPRTSSRKWRWR